MSKSQKKRPRDFNQAANLVVDIATGQVEDASCASQRAFARSNRSLAMTLTTGCSWKSTARTSLRPDATVKCLGVRRGTPEPHHADAYAPLYPADQCVFKEGREPWARHGASRYVLPLKVTPAMRPGVT